MRELAKPPGGGGQDPNAAYFSRRRCSAFVVGRAILPWGPLWGRILGGVFGTRERVFEGQRPAESRLQPGLAAPRFGRYGLQDQKVCRIWRECLRHVLTGRLQMLAQRYSRPIAIAIPVAQRLG